MRTWKPILGVVCLLSAAMPLPAATEFHVALSGKDENPGTTEAPLRTIQRAADLAQPGDMITVHAGIYRERVNPPRGGASEAERIVYRAAPGDAVEIRGSEVITGWTQVQGDVWKVEVPNLLFGEFNPYREVIRGDWFNGRGRAHHPGAVYLDGEWLVEAAALEDVLNPSGADPRPARPHGGFLLNIRWLKPSGAAAGDAGRVPAARFASQTGVRAAPCDEGGECLGWIEAGDWVRYDGVDFGARTESVELRAASATDGGRVELRLDRPDGEILGACDVKNTGGWQTWTTVAAPVRPVSGSRTLFLVFQPPRPDAPPLRLWFARVDETNTTIWAQFLAADPNRRQTEINVRQTVFYPDRPGRNYITVRGFALRHAATPWAPPTAEQIGLIGTHWSQGWIIESNLVSHSACSGISLGKHGDRYDNTSANTAEGYVKTIERAHAHDIPWVRGRIGGHLVRDNRISHCEQAGIVGSLGAAFSVVRGNTIHDIHVRRLFTGDEMAGIKFHGAIDTQLIGNHVYRTGRGLWLDWMAQGTRVSGNLFHDNDVDDIFLEVNHGPFLVDNNLFLSDYNMRNMSQGGAFAHNLWAGRICPLPEAGRRTPYHPAHSTEIAGLDSIRAGDHRFFNNIFVSAAGHGLQVYDQAGTPPITAAGNVYLRGARPYAKETGAVVLPGTDPRLRLELANGRTVLNLVLDGALARAETALVTSERLGRAVVPNIAYVNPDGSPIALDTDFFGAKRSPTRPTPGPFENPGEGPRALILR